MKTKIQSQAFAFFSLCNFMLLSQFSWVVLRDILSSKEDSLISLLAWISLLILAVGFLRAAIHELVQIYKNN